MGTTRSLFLAASGYAWVLAATAQNNAIFQGGSGDGYSRGSGPGLSIFSGGSGDGYSRGSAQFPAPNIFAGGGGDGYSRAHGFSVRVQLEAHALLEGPYNTGTQLMNDNLRSTGIVPLLEPFSAMGYPSAGGGGETTDAATLAMTGTTAVVDWVRIELRDATTPATLIAARHGLLRRDGSITDPLTGASFISFNLLPASYHVVVRHRNHLGVMTASSVVFTGNTELLDLTSASTSTFGTNARKTVGTVQVLWSGDVTGNHQVKYTGSGSDRDPILVKVGSTTPNNIVTGQYLREDVNMDAVVKYTGSSNDRDPILVNVGSTTPNNTRAEQVP
jgi:hypothetical protein